MGSFLSANFKLTIKEDLCLLFLCSVRPLPDNSTVTVPSWYEQTDEMLARQGLRFLKLFSELTPEWKCCLPEAVVAIRRGGVH